MGDLQNAPVAVVPSHAWEVIERWLVGTRAILRVRGKWVAAERWWWFFMRDVASASTIPELAGKLRGEVRP